MPPSVWNITPGFRLVNREIYPYTVVGVGYAWAHLDHPGYWVVRQKVSSGYRHIVIVGGGFAGTRAAQTLECMLPPAWTPTLIVQENFITSTRVSGGNDSQDDQPVTRKVGRVDRASVP